MQQPLINQVPKWLLGGSALLIFVCFRLDVKDGVAFAMITGTFFAVLPLVLSEAMAHRREADEPSSRASQDLLDAEAQEGATTALGTSGDPTGTRSKRRQISLAITPLIGIAVVAAMLKDDPVWRGSTPKVVVTASAPSERPSSVVQYDFNETPPINGLVALESEEVETAPEDNDVVAMEAPQVEPLDEGSRPSAIALPEVKREPEPARVAGQNLQLGVTDDHTVSQAPEKALAEPSQVPEPELSAPNDRSTGNSDDAVEASYAAPAPLDPQGLNEPKAPELPTIKAEVTAAVTAVASEPKPEVQPAIEHEDVTPIPVKVAPAVTAPTPTPAAAPPPAPPAPAPQLVVTGSDERREEWEELLEDVLLENGLEVPAGKMTLKVHISYLREEVQGGDSNIPHSLVRIHAKVRFELLQVAENKRLALATLKGKSSKKFVESFTDSAKEACEEQAIQDTLDQWVSNPKFTTLLK